MAALQEEGNLAAAIAGDWVCREPLIVPQNLTLSEVAAQMQGAGVAQAIVTDLEGDWLGVVPWESILRVLDPIALHWQNQRLQGDSQQRIRVFHAAHPGEKKAADGGRSPRRVLLIEGMSEESILLPHLLHPPHNSQLRFQVTQVDNLAAAIAQLKAEPYDLLLLDLELPEVRGFRAFEQLQTYAQMIPLILLVADETTHHREIQDCLNAGAQDYLLKSLCAGQSATERELLMRSIRYVLENHRVQTAIERQNRQLTGQNHQLRRQISAQTELVQRLQNSDAQVNRIFEAIADIVLLIDPDHWQIQSVTTQPSPSHSQEIAQTITYLQTQREQYLPKVRQAIAEQTQLHEEYLLEGDRWFAAKLSPATNNQVLWVAHDITPIKQAQQELFLYQQKLEAKVQERTSQLRVLNQTLKAEINQRTYVEAELRRERNFLSTVFNLAGALLLVLDRHGRIVRFNPACEKVTGYSFEEVQGKYIWELFLRAEDTVGMMQKLRYLISDKGTSSQEIDWRARDGKLHRISWEHSTLLNEQGEVHYIISAGIDISDRQDLEMTLKTLNQELEKRVEERTETLEKIQQNLRRQLAAVDAAVEAIAILQENNFVSVNPAFLDLFGYPHLLSLQHRSWDVLFDRSEQERLQTQIIPQLHQEHSWRGEAIARRQDGSTFIQEVSLTLSNDQLLICVCRDISARKADAEKLRNTEVLLRSQYDNFPIPTYTWRHQDQDLYLINYNAAADKDHNHKLAQFLNRSSQVLYGDQHEIHRNLRQCFQQRQGFSVELNIQEHSRTYPELRYLAVTYVYIEPDMVMVHTQDLTERKDAETKLHRNQTFLRQVIDNDPNLIFVKDHRGRFLLANQAVADLYGTTIAHLMHKTDADFNPQTDELERFAYTDQLVLSQGQPILFQEEKVTDHTGKEHYFRMIKIPLKIDDEMTPSQILGVASNVTQQRQAKLQLEASLQQARDLNHLKTRFIDITSHEFRTPLTVILGATDILMHYAARLTPERQLKHLTNIQENAQRIEQLIDDLLSMSRIESGKLQCYRRPTDVVQFCQSVLEEIQLGVGKDHQLEFLADPAVPASLEIDPELVRHILSNLLTNACKYSAPASKVIFKVNYHQSTLIFAVEDQGIGIPPEEQPHLFESFYRASNVQTIPGTGLGLNIVLEYAKLHGGTVDFVSEVNGGTTFFVELPIV